jgi:hypothetical protein
VPALVAKDRAPKNWLEGFVAGVSCGALSSQVVGKIANWLHVHIGEEDHKAKLACLLGLTIMHACTLFITTLLHPKEDQVALLNDAWRIQTETSRTLVVDVDADALGKLEQLMFEVLHTAGRAGDYQWGLRKGQHQENWDPYHEMPQEWDTGEQNVDCSKQTVCLFLSFFHKGN